MTYNGVKYDSIPEVTLAKWLDTEGYNSLICYHLEKVSYTIPESKHNYYPDWKMKHIIWEVKGVYEYGLTVDERKKYLYVKKNNPELDIRFIFTNPNFKINPNSKTTYAMWAEKNGFKWCERIPPKEWITDLYG